MDVDTTRSKNSYENIYNTFKEGKADILNRNSNDFKRD